MKPVETLNGPSAGEVMDEHAALLERLAEIAPKKPDLSKYVTIKEMCAIRDSENSAGRERVRSIAAKLEVVPYEYKGAYYYTEEQARAILEAW